MNFRTAYSESVHKPSASGSKWRKNYVRSTSLDGRMDLEEAPPSNQYEAIQMAAIGILPEELLRRAATGDPNAIKPDLGSYADLKNAPKSLEEALSHAMRVKDLYSSLPKDIRSFYGNDINKVVAAIDDGSIFKAFESSSTVPVSSSTISPHLTNEEIEKIKEKLNKGEI